MKYNIHFLLLFLAFTLTFSACIEEDLVEYPETNLTRNDALQQILVNTPVVSFVAGEPGYDIEFLSITPDSDNFKSINVYKTYTDAATAAVSAEVLHGTYDVPSGQNTALLQDNLTFEELSDGITINGGPLPTDQVLIPVGSKWDLRLEPVDASGGAVDFGGSSAITIAVLSPFAGIYTVIESDYWRIGVQSGAADWTGQERFIGSVDANTFSHVDSWGPFVAGDGAVGQFVFDLNADNTITVIDDPSQLFFSGNDMLTCQEDGSIFVNVPCAGSNVLEPKADGKHIIKLTYGYFTDNSGPREFYEVLEKNVD